MNSNATNQHVSAATVGDEEFSGVKRKPVAAPTPAYIPPKEIAVNNHVQHRQDTFDTLPPRNQYPKSSIISRLKTRWSILQKRTRIAIIAAVVIIVALIIGLSAGLASRSKTSNLPLPNNHGGPYSGDLTYYDPALGSCGFTNSASDNIVAVSHVIYDAVSIGSNPNANPLCGKKIRARRNGKSIDLTVVDRCTGCAPTDIDTTRSVFSALANIDQGRVPVEWSWLENVPDPASG